MNNPNKQQIEQWLKDHRPKLNNDIIAKLIEQCFQDIMSKLTFTSVDDNPPPHKEWVLFKVKYKDWTPVIRSGYAKHYENGEVLIVIPEFGKTGDREVIGWIPFKMECEYCADSGYIPDDISGYATQCTCGAHKL